MSVGWHPKECQGDGGVSESLETVKAAIVSLQKRENIDIGEGELESRE
jgi:hypothetical protein